MITDFLTQLQTNSLNSFYTLHIPRDSGLPYLLHLNAMPNNEETSNPAI